MDKQYPLMPPEAARELKKAVVEYTKIRMRVDTVTMLKQKLFNFRLKLHGAEDNVGIRHKAINVAEVTADAKPRNGGNIPPLVAAMNEFISEIEERYGPLDKILESVPDDL